MARSKSDAGAGVVRRYMLADALRRFCEQVSQGLLRRFSRGWSADLPMVAVPNALRAGNAKRGETLIAGHFTVAGRTVDHDPTQALTLKSPGEDWANYIHGFAWLRDLAMVEGSEAEAMARLLVDQWMRVQAGGACWKMSLTAARLIALLADAPLLLGGSDRGFYIRFRQIIASHVAFLRNGLALRLSPSGRDELLALTALVQAHLVVDPMPRSVQQLGRRLERALAVQIFTDGGHLSRNPEAVLDLLAVFIPLRDLYIAREVPPPSGLLLAIERMLPMLRFFSHVDGSLALMNGMGPTDRATLAKVLASDEVQGKPALEAQGSGYQRLEAPECALILDCGAPPPPAEAADAHAGTLAFELSARGERLVVNCGIPAYQRAPWRHFTRRTSAHSTLTIDDQSSSRIFAFAGREIPGDGPTHIPVVRTRDGEITMVSASHNGYASRFGLIHQRTLWLAQDGRRLDGEDRLEALNAWAGRIAQPFAIRFHLHPDIKPSLADTGDTAILQTGQGHYWAFRVPGGKVDVEESAFLGETGRAPRSAQLVIRGTSGRDVAISWFFVLLKTAP